MPLRESEISCGFSKGVICIAFRLLIEQTQLILRATSLRISIYADKQRARASQFL